LEQSAHENIPTQDPAPLPSGALLRSGLAWNTIYQVFSSAVAFGSMLILVRIFPPREYGRAAAVSAFLALLNCLNCRTYVGHSLQLRHGVEADWSQHFSFAFYGQSLLALTCNLVAAVCWFLPAYRDIAPLLHLASVGVFLDGFNQVSSLQLERAMDFKRLRILGFAGTILYTGTVLAFGFSGWGAAAIVLGSQVSGFPLGFDLFFVRRWRPRGGWWCGLDWRSYRASLKWGFVMASSASMSAASSGLEFAVLPGRVGFTAMGLWNRGQALFTISIARILGVLQQTAYPLLPRYAADHERYRPYATLFEQIMLWLLIPSTMFLGLEGKSLSRLLYGMKWVAADPMIWPGAILGLGTWLFTAAGVIQFAASRLRICFKMDTFSALMCLPALAIVLISKSIVVYAWVFACGQLLVGLVNFYLSAKFIDSRWAGRVLLPAIVSTCAGCAAVFVIHRLHLPLLEHLIASAVAYFVANLIVMRVCFSTDFTSVLLRMPRGKSLARWMRLEGGAARVQA
jgi:O-antigen/teichoic acid export membrane protein